MNDDTSQHGPAPNPSDFAAFQRARRRFLEQVSDRTPLYPPLWGEADDDGAAPDGRAPWSDPPV
jgi:hypothetical protein